MNKKIILLFITLLFLVPSIVFADVIMPGEKAVSYCFEISNINDFPNYTFKLELPLAGHSEEILVGECKRFYKHEYPSIFAVDQDKNYYYSSLKIQSISTVPINDPREKVQDVFTIMSIEGNNLKLEKTKVVYYYTDGTNEDVVYQDENIRPEPTQKPLRPWWLEKYFGLAFIVTFLVEFLIIWVFMRGGPIKPLIVSFIINVITVPLANLFNYEYGIDFLYLEVYVFVAEIFLLVLFTRIRFFRAALVSFLMNAATAMIGLYYFEFFSMLINLK